MDLMPYETVNLLDKMRAVVTKHADVSVCRDTLDALNNPRPHGRMRDWFVLNNGRTVTTIQVTARSVWSPVGRVIDADSRATYVVLNGSAREYRGFRVLHAGSDVLIVQSPDEVIAYIRD